MKIHEPGIYHIYNRGNEKQKIFFSDNNYLYFLRKCEKYLKQVSDILAWCLMPNHFHFLIYVSDISLVPVKAGSIYMPAITNGFRLLQSSYAKGFNVQNQRTGNLFQQKTKAKLTETRHAISAFHYIHQNPLASKLVTDPNLWPYSSYLDYAGLRNGILVNKSKAFELLDMLNIDFKAKTLEIIQENEIEEFF